MISRVTSSQVNATLTNQINRQYTKYATLNEQIASGYKINSITDNPTQAINIINANKQLDSISIWSDNVSALTNEIQQSSDTIDSSIDYVQRAKDLATTAATGTSTKDQLQATLDEIDSLIKGTVSLANTNYNGNYIYAGTNTKTAPYEIEYGVDSDGNKTDEIVGIKYTGTPLTGDWQRKLEVSEGEFEHVNVTGIEAFGDYDTEAATDAEGNVTYNVKSKSGIFSNLMELRNSLKTTISNIETQENLPETATEAERKTAAEAVTAGYDSIRATIDGFTDSISKMSAVNTKFGTLTNKLEMTSTSLENSSTNLTEHISDMRDLDVTAAVSEWYSAQYAYQASMQASTSIMSMSLLNYM